MKKKGWSGSPAHTETTKNGMGHVSKPVHGGNPGGFATGVRTEFAALPTKGRQSYAPKGAKMDRGMDDD